MEHGITILGFNVCQSRDYGIEKKAGIPYPAITFPTCAASEYKHILFMSTVVSNASELWI